PPDPVAAGRGLLKRNPSGAAQACDWHKRGMPMRNSRTVRHLLLATTFIGVSGASRGAAPAVPDSTAVDAQANQNEIFVTAQKRSEKLQNVPIQVNVLTGKTLDARQMKMTNEIARTVSNLTIEKTDVYSNSVIVLRGISQAANADAPVAVIVDGVPQDDPKQFNMHLLDIADIEVLKGPQGSLYGRNAEAGAIIITTAQPTNEFHGFVDGSFGRGSTLEAS